MNHLSTLQRIVSPTEWGDEIAKVKSANRKIVDSHKTFLS